MYIISRYLPLYSPDGFHGMGVRLTFVLSSLSLAALMAPSYMANRSATEESWGSKVGSEHNPLHVLYTPLIYTSDLHIPNTCTCTNILCIIMCIYRYMYKSSRDSMCCRRHSYCICFLLYIHVRTLYHLHIYIVPPTHVHVHTCSLVPRLFLCTQKRKENQHTHKIWGCT